MQYLYLKQKVFSIGESFTFLSDQKEPVFTAKGSFFAMPKRYKLFDAVSNTEIIEITRKFFSWTPTFTITESKTKQQLFTVKQRFRLGRPRFDISTPAGNYMIEGELFAHEFDIVDPQGKSIVTVRKKWISWGDTYEIWADTSQIPLHVAASIVLTFDCAIHSNNSR